jgi:hypothetical protein
MIAATTTHQLVLQRRELRHKRRACLAMLPKLPEWRHLHTKAGRVVYPTRSTRLLSLEHGIDPVAIDTFDQVVV